nr:MAG TPA: hypothetical protein [Caudoviricetes sp.]
MLLLSDINIDLQITSFLYPRLSYCFLRGYSRKLSSIGYFS